MDRERLKIIIKNLKLLVDSLESEVFSDIDAYKQDKNYKKFSSHGDDDGYPD
jgi:hypothetical protein